MSLLDFLPPPAECSPAQRETAVVWYAAQDIEAVTEFMKNTQMRIYREFYGQPRKRLMGDKLVNLYQMRDIINEALRRKRAIRPTKPRWSQNIIGQ